MTMILSKKLLNSTVLFDFYAKRFTRIVPLFACILSSVYLVGWFFLMEIDRMQLLTDIKWSLTFTSNMQTLFEVKGYWDQVLSYRFLVHCWSLGVEIQFYIIAPFILGYCRQPNWNLLDYILLVCSFIFQLTTESKIAYGLLFSRIWQFFCARIAFEIEKKTSGIKECQKLCDDEISLFDGARVNIRTTGKRLLMYTIIRELLIVSLIATVFMNSDTIGNDGIRLFGTLLTTAYICSSNIAVFSFATSKSLVYIGDISYTLYLVHWPTIVFYKYYYSLTDLAVNDAISCVFAMFVITVALHHTLENFLVRTRHLYALLIFAGCILFIASTSPFYEKDIEIFQQHNKSEVIANAIRINAEEDKRGAYETPAILNSGTKNYFWVPCHRDFEAEKWTNWTTVPQLRCGSEGNGTLNVLVMGNSIAYRAFPTIHSLFKGRFNKIKLFATNGKPGIYSSKKSDGLAARYESALRLLVEKFKPDVIFIIFTTNYSRKIVVDLPYYYNHDLRYAQDINRRLKFGKSLDDLKTTRQEVYDQQHWHHERLRRINCSTCIINDIGESLFDRDNFYWYDRQTYLALVTDGVHFSQAGLKCVRNTYENIVEKVIEELN